MAASEQLKFAMAQLAAEEPPALGFQPSKLGTQAHWNGVYEREVKMFKEIGDEGEVWFGEDSADAMMDWAIDHLPPTADLQTLDVGTGNGQLLYVFHEAGYKNLVGIDYSESSITLAKAIAKQREISNVELLVCDILKEEISGKEGKQFDLVLDKGTYDAICLSDESIDGKSLQSVYPSRIARLLAPDGIFLITSCNWTRSELETAFETAGLKYFSHIPRPSFGFGGSVGSTITTIAFKHVSS